MSTRKLILATTTFSVFLSFFQFALAWVEPTTVPTGNNIFAPLNSSAFGQSKVGGLILNLGNAAHGLIVRYGLVGIGTDNPQSALDVVGKIRSTGLEVTSTTEGALLPRMTTSERDAISSKVDGLLIYNTTAKQLEIYSDGSWKASGGSNGGGDSIPKGTIVAFNKIDCPTGWAAADGTQGTPDLRGVFVRGLDAGRGLDSGRTISSYQDDDMRSHTHSTVQMIYNNSIDGVDSALTYSGEHHNEPRNTGATGGSETRPKNVALVYCVKLTEPSSSGTSTGTSTTSAGDSFWKSNGLNISYNDGNVGIGTSNPSKKLQIEGSIGAYSLCLSGDCRGSWSVPRRNCFWVSATMTGVNDSFTIQCPDGYHNDGLSESTQTVQGACGAETRYLSSILCCND